APLMIVGLVVGVAVSLVQALTQIQEQTLVFVPKIIAIFATMLLVLPFMGDLMAGCMTRVMAKVVTGG
ncbi:flagellar biosynthetic protein FliQ, partial [Klebsiella pneumoniae]|uniref:flagellar biosynthetic protein FliQ n=1 Tax=Klebsiella pneumoniae TaxID=573 RepID=UPI0013D25FBF